MTTITLSPEITERVAKAAAQRGLSPDEYAAFLMQASLEADQAEFEDSCHAIAEGIADMEAGRMTSLEDFIAERRAKRAVQYQERETNGK